jgi:hypothetical protein
MNSISNERSEILNSKSSFILVSYYWGEEVVNRGSVHGLTYGEQVKRIIKDCQKLNINYYFVRMIEFEKKGTYQQALSYKPGFIQKCLDLFPNYKCIFLDTDLRVLNYPHLFEVDADCFFINWNEYDWGCYNPYQLVLPGAVLGFANTKGAREMLKILTDYMNKNQHLAEDKTFSGIITRHFMNVYLRCVWLPETYLYMFEKHKYSPKLGKYTYVADYKKELKDSRYKMKDLVLVHEDFETGALEDLYKKRVLKERFPPNFNRQQGEKLRCFDIVFKNYMNYGLNKYQMKQYTIDNRRKQRYKIAEMKMLIKMNVGVKYNVMKERKYFNCPFYMVTLYNAKVDSKKSVERWVEMCERYNLSYKIYKVNDEISKPRFFYKVLKELKMPIRYTDIKCRLKANPIKFYIKNMDLMTVNLNNLYNTSGCSDMRVLKMMNDNVYCLDYNRFVMDFLKIWEEYNKKDIIKNKVQHKSLEYAFNISLSTNKLRCYWLNKKYILDEKVEKNYLIKKLKGDYKKVPKDYKTITTKLQQCGIKPPLNEDSDPVRAHHYGSKVGALYHNKYGEKFLEYF